MKETSWFIKFNYKSAIIFFSFVIIINLLLCPLIQQIGFAYQTSLFIANSIACSIGLPFVVLKLEGKYKNRRQALKFILISTAVCTLMSYFLLFPL
ncbi:hypothetical protein [Gottfriedia acidiceleris]|uniref:Uncharacterized protein n=1 Tax=Gottfriedia acidiceleris TaxID=371036 RepID=A0ABY4JLY0_9BACI|nr:hypothetical protein [Gottfriedia acidiceleris]UPM54856.1 hypothetical protein MY490_03000 [Gottfriedia acidiceleris]